MQPEQNIMSNVLDNPKDATSLKKSKKKNSMMIGMVLLATLAVCGIGFGVWAMLRGEQRVVKLNEQITELNNNIAERDERITQLENSGTAEEGDGGADEGSINGDNVNPVLPKSNNPDSVDRVFFVSDGNPRVRILVEGGELSSCSFESDENRDGGWNSEECDLGDVGGKIYKVVSFGGTQEYDPYIGLIMADGTVRYFSFYNAINNRDFTLKTLKLNGEVVDAIKITSGPSKVPAGGYVTNVFVLKNGSVVRFDESMTN